MSRNATRRSPQSTAALPPSPFPTDDPILQRIGGTPMIPYPGVADGRLLCKLESENPTRSMKDRIAMGILSEALQEHDYDTVVEASSGNTAGAVALVANRLGVDCILTCPEGTSPDKIGYMKAFGAEVHTCPDVDSDHPEHYRATARRLAEAHGAFLVDQYHNLSNPGAHYRWTGREIWAQAGAEMTHLVSAMGTGGLLSGCARRVKEEARAAGREVTVVGVDATHSNISTAFRGDDPVPYDTCVEGLGKGGALPTMWFDYIDTMRDVPDDRAFAQARTAAQEHGMPIGPSAGAALSVAEAITTEQPEARVVTIICDGGEQYFDSLFGV
jgi:cystathionine beta-synthase/cysteine synthase A